VTPRNRRSRNATAEEGAHERKQGDDRLVAQILDMLGLSAELLPLFRQRGIDDDALMELTAPDLRRLGVAPGAALDVLGAVRAAKKERALDDGGRPPRSPARIPPQAVDDSEATPSRGRRRRGRRTPRTDGSPTTPSTPAGTPTTPAGTPTPADSPRTPAETPRNNRRRRRRSQPET